MSPNLNSIIEETQVFLLPAISASVGRIEKDDIFPMLSLATTAKKVYDRALMVRLGCEAVGGTWRDSLHAMVAVELMDFSVIVIDDILDESPRRRQELTIQKRWGTKKAIIVASILKSMATHAALSVGDGIVTSGRIKDIIDIFEQVHREIYIGQYLDIKYESFDFNQVDEKNYLEMIQYTTGIQISGCCRMGGIIGGGDDKDIAALGNYGLYTGTIFQIRDDLIDYIDAENDTWKTPFLDFTRKKKRLPLLIAMKNSTKSEKMILQSLFNKKRLNSKDKGNLLQIIAKKENEDNIRKIIDELKSKAWASIKNKNLNVSTKAIFKELLELGCNV